MKSKEVIEVLQYHLASLIKDQEQRIDWAKGDIPTDILEMKQRTIKAEQDLIDSLLKALSALEENFKLEIIPQDEVKAHIKLCEGKHRQQVAYSSYHDALTQVCFDCKKIRTNGDFK